MLLVLFGMRGGGGRKGKGCGVWGLGFGGSGADRRGVWKSVDLACMWAESVGLAYGSRAVFAG